MLPASDVAAGLAVLLALLAAALVAGHLGTRRLAPGLDGIPYGLAVLVAATVALLAAVILPGALGTLRPLPVLGAAVAIAAGLAWRAPAGAWRLPPRPAFAAGPVAGIALLAVAACALAYLRRVAGAPVLSIDALNFNLAIPADWIGERSVWGLHQFIPDYSNATYPHHGNALLAAAMLCFSSPALAQLVAVPYWAAAGAAVAAVARELGAPPAPSALAGAAFAALPVVLQAGVPPAPPSHGRTRGARAGRPRPRGGARDEVVRAAQRTGLGLGVALGTKWYALPSVAVVLALWGVARRRRLAAEAPLLLAVVAAAGGFWFARNWVQTGNPLFPQALPPLFAGPRDDPIREAGGWTLAHYLTDGAAWRDYLWPALRASFGAGGVIVAVGGAAAAVAGRRDRRVLILAAGAAALAAAYVVTPYSAFGPEGRPVLASASTRYGLPALMAAAVLAAWLASRGRRWAVGVQAALLAGLADGLRRFFDLGPGDLALGAVLASAVAVGAARLPPRVLAGAAVVALAGVVAVAAGRADRQGYARFDPAFAYIEARAPEGRRIGVAGTWTPEGVPPPLPAFGRRLGNRVDYVGVFREHLLRRHTSARAFAAAAAGYDLLLLGTGIPAGSDTREIRWARAAGWRDVSASPRLVLLAR